MSVENLAEDLLNEPEEEREKKEPKISGSVKDDILEGVRAVDEEMRQLEQNITESKEAKLGTIAEFQKELSVAKKELREWGKLLKLSTKKRAPTAAEAAVLREERLATLNKAAEAAKGAGVENLENVEAELRATEEAIQEYEPLDITEAQPSAFQAEGMALREKERLLTEARFWLKKAMIIQSLMEVKAPTASETPALGGSQPKNSKISERKGESLERSTAEMNYVEVIKPESELEERILRDPEWRRGAEWGKQRRGRHEGETVFLHITEVLRNIDKLQDISEHERAQLRLIAILHDAFKYRVDMSKPRFGDNHHGSLARKFAEKYTQDEVALKIIQRHDDAFNAWRSGNETGKWEQAEKRVQDLIMKKISRDNIRLYLLFYQCDNETGTKSQESLQWFKEKVKGL